MKWTHDRLAGRYGKRELVTLGAIGFFGIALLGGTERARQGGDTAAGGLLLEQASMHGAGSARAAGFQLATDEWDLPNLDHERIDFWIERFTTDKRPDFTRFLERTGRYGPMISEKLAERDMPQDLIYLAMIESGMNPQAYSHAHAAGLWQFISETGRRYGLTVNNVVDERYDPLKATDAALDYLTYLKNRLGSWYLAAAGYNTGENRVARIMREVTGSEKGTDQDFYRIWSRLPRETRDYVPLMIAAARISKDPARYGFEDVVFQDALAFDEVVADAGATLTQIARASGTELAEVRRLNPHLRNQRLPTNRPYAVRVPQGTAQQFAQNWSRVQAETPAPELASAATATRAHRVRSGENLTVIARRHGTTVSAIRSQNGLRGDRIRAGQTLRIPSAR
jgi:membrane-bound lytic murein transglycosylase D